MHSVNAKYVSVTVRYWYPPLFSFGTPGAKTKKEPKCIPVVKKLL